MGLTMAMAVPLLAAISSFYVIDIMAAVASNRTKRAFLGYCPNGALAVSACFPNRVCGQGFYCDIFTNRCCPGPYVPIVPTYPPYTYPTYPFTTLPTYPTFPPYTPIPPVSLVCQDGNPAASVCAFTMPQCQAGYVCTNRGLCCRSGTAASCNFISVPTHPCPLGQSQCATTEYCSNDHYCCPKTVIPIGPCLPGGTCPLGYRCINNQCYLV